MDVWPDNYDNGFVGANLDLCDSQETKRVGGFGTSKLDVSARLGITGGDMDSLSTKTNGDRSDLGGSGNLLWLERNGRNPNRMECEMAIAGSPGHDFGSGKYGGGEVFGPF
ncbi:MAG: hypothetical protein UX21_C0005G0004 [Microgenomates group bacterium GW2011_GWC2_45_8]|nr:MAG: hypothetical protein UX21_C0005G0004 [Microgenomates group bacterium GW2011_GWC2_45_8]